MKYRTLILLLLLAALQTVGQEKQTPVETPAAQPAFVDEVLKKMYGLIETEPKRAQQMADSLLLLQKQRTGLSARFVGDANSDKLHFFKGEVLYHTGKYMDAIKEFGLIKMPNAAAQVNKAALLVKMKNNEAALKLLNGMYFDDMKNFALGNYEEVTGQKDKALMRYIALHKTIKKDVPFYKKLVERIYELQKQNPVLLTELYFMTGRGFLM